MSNKEPGYVYILTNLAYQGALFFSYNGMMQNNIRKGKDK